MNKIISILILTLFIISCNNNTVTEKGNEQSEKTLNYSKALVFKTVKDSPKRLHEESPLSFNEFDQPLETQPSIFIDPLHSFQNYVGIGAALSDAAAETFDKLPAEQQEELLLAYFDKEKGIAYNMARTNMNSCDFSSDMYTYVDEGDSKLLTFSIDHDKQYKIPFIRKALEASGNDLKLFMSPWSPPAWMKSNNHMLQGGSLLPEYYDVWANYFVKFIKSYEKEGIPVWGMSVQNEPMATQTWESCIYTAEEENTFIRDHLGPVLWKEGLKDKKLIAWDHNRDLIYQRASTYLNDEETAKYIWGIGFHWYEIWNGGRQYENVKRVAESFPEKQLLLTEACNYPFSWEHFDEWHWGEQYGENMIHDFNNGAVAWVDWNILLNEIGGPNHVGNYCYAPVHAKTNEGSLHYMNSYYYIGHLSKFIQPAAKRIISSSSRAQMLTTAFLNPDKSIVVVVMNPTEEEFNFRLYLKDQAIEAISEARSIATYVLK